MGQDHQDLSQHNGTTSGSTSTPRNSCKGLGPTKGKKKASKPCPSTSTGSGSTSHPMGSSRNPILCSACGKNSHWSKDCPYNNFCDVCKVMTHSTHMCRASKHGNSTTGSPLCIYCSKTNHRSVYYRYRPRDNCEEPRNTPDALRTGTKWQKFGIGTQKLSWSYPSPPFSHSDGRSQGQLRSQPRGQHS